MAVAVAVRELAQRMGYLTEPEVTGFFYAGDDRFHRRPDFVAPKADGCFVMWDVSLVDPCASSFVAYAARHDLGASRKRDQAKRDKYDKEGDPASCTSQGHTFVPLAMETSGAFGPSMAKWFQAFISAEREREVARGGSGWAATGTGIYWQQKIAAALHRSIAIRLARRMRVHGPGR